MVVKDIWLHERSKLLWPVSEDNREFPWERPRACSQCVWLFAVGLEIQRKASTGMGVALMEWLKDAWHMGSGQGIWKNMKAIQCSISFLDLHCLPATNNERPFHTMIINNQLKFSLHRYKSYVPTYFYKSLPLSVSQSASGTSLPLPAPSWYLTRDVWST